MEASKRVVIVGGGIVGVSTAYFLSLRGLSSIIIDKSGIAASASGKAGGFLARGWGNQTTAELHEKGFQMHEQLAKDLDLKSFRYIPTVEVGHVKRPMGNKKRKPGDDKCHVDSLLNNSTTKSRMMDEGTAQVTPSELVTKMFDVAKSYGATFRRAKVVGITKASDGSYQGIKLEDGELLEADVIVLAMGAWGVEIDDWIDNLRVPMVGIASSSMIIDPKAEFKDAPACFCGEDENDCHLELYPRPDNTIYVCGLGGSPHLQKSEIQSLSPEEVKPDTKRISKAIDSFRRITNVKNIETEQPEFSENLKIQSCLRPCTNDSLPMIGSLPKSTSNSSDLIVAHGHNCWGILWGPITGKSIAQMILDGKTEISLKHFDPLRFS